jgi:WD40 repeat protein
VAIWPLCGDRPFPDFGAFPLSGLPAFDPDGQRLWAVLDETTVLAWRWPDGGVACRWENPGGTGGLDSIYALAAGRRWVLAGGRDGTTHLLRARDAQPARTLTGPGAAVRAVALSPDESLAAAGTQQGTVRLYHLPGGEQVTDLTEPRGAIEAVAFSPGGELLAAGGRDREVFLYDVRGAEARLLVRLPCPGGTVQALRFHPDGDQLAVVVQRESAVRVWQLDLLRQRLGEMGLAEGWPLTGPGRR